MKKLFAVFFLSVSSLSLAQATEAEIEKVISITAHNGMSVEGVYGKNKLYRSLFQTPSVFRKEFCKINPKRMKTCSEKEFRRLPAGEEWNFPAIPEVAVIHSTEQSVTAQTTYTKDSRGFYRVTENTIIETTPPVSVSERFIQITARERLTVRSVYEKNVLYKSLFPTPAAFIAEVCKINPDKADCSTGAPLSLKGGDTLNFPAIRGVYLLNSSGPIVTGQTTYTKTERGVYRDTARRVILTDPGG